jgi:ATP-dependent RNA helicase DeaD
MPLKPELIESLRRAGFTTATEVQDKSIPELLQGRNLIVRAKTGTGKTVAFVVPILQRIDSRSRDVEALIVVPTRELALQVSSVTHQLGSYMHIEATTIYGGASINVQIQSLRAEPNVVVGTPGRLMDLYKRGALNLDNVKFLVLDEADMMLDMGFIGDVEYIISKTPYDKQLMLFSATIPREIVKMAEGYSSGRIERIIVGEEEKITVESINHIYAVAPGGLRYAALLAYIKQYSPRKAIIFARTKFEANTIHRVLLSQSHDAILLHGGLTQAAREKSLGHFRKGGQLLVATNVAARGLDIDDVTDVINFGVPEEPNVYVHRVGRSARMGKEGRAFTIATAEQRREIRDIEDYANIKINLINLDLEPFKNLQLPLHQPREGRGFRDRSGGGRYEGRGGGGRRFGGGRGGGGGRYGGREEQPQAAFGFRRRRGFRNFHRE